MTGAVRSPATSGLIDLTEPAAQEPAAPADVIDVTSSIRAEGIDAMFKRLSFLAAFDADEFTSEIDEQIDDPDLRHSL